MTRDPRLTSTYVSRAIKLSLLSNIVWSTGDLFFLNETYATCPTRNSTDSRQTRSMRQTPVYRHLICQSKSVLLNRVVNKLRTRLEDSSKLMTLVSETRVWCFLDRFCVQWNRTNKTNRSIKWCGRSFDYKLN